MEAVFEVILEIVVEGVFVTATAKRVPIPLRILAGIATAALIVGVLFLLIFTGIICFKSSEIAHGNFVGALMFIGAAVLFIGAAYRVARFMWFKNR